MRYFVRRRRHHSHRRLLSPALMLPPVHDHERDRDSDPVCHAHPLHDRVQTEAELQASHYCDSYSGPGQTTIIPILGVVYCPKTRALLASFLSFLAMGEEAIHFERDSMSMMVMDGKLGRTSRSSMILNPSICSSTQP